MIALVASIFAIGAVAFTTDHSKKFTEYYFVADASGNLQNTTGVPPTSNPVTCVGTLKLCVKSFTSYHEINPITHETEPAGTVVSTIMKD